MTSLGRRIWRRRHAPGRGRPAWTRAGPLLQWMLVALAIGCALAVAGPASGRRDAGGTVDGAQLYARSCANCHGNTGEGTFRGPSLIGVGAASADYWLRSGRMPLREPDQQDRRRPPVFDDAEIRALVDHVASFGDGPAIPDIDIAGADLARGGELYRVNCASCHNWDGKGGAMVNRDNAAPLHPVPNRQVAEAVRIGPGTMPRFTAEQLDDRQLEQVVAYVDYLRAPRDAGGHGLAHWGPATETVAGVVGVGVVVLATAWLGERRRG